MPDNVRSAILSPLIQKEAQNLSLCTSTSTLISAFPSFSPWTPAMSQIYDYSFLLFLFGALGVCLEMETKRYKNTIRIRITKQLAYDDL